MSCLITQGIDASCESARKVGGLAQRVWLVSGHEGFSFTLASGVVTALTFDTYGGLVPFKSVKNSHSSGNEFVRTGDGGNGYFTHNVTIKTLPQTADDDNVLEDLVGWVGAIVVETRNREFLLYGAVNGMQLATDVQTFGAVDNTDISDILTFVGAENSKPYRILDTDYSTTLALLKGYEI